VRRRRHHPEARRQTLQPVPAAAEAPPRDADRVEHVPAIGEAFVDRPPAAPELAGEERQVEPHVVADHDRPAHQLDHPRQDVGEQRLAGHHLLRDPRERHDPGPDPPLRVDELLVLRDAAPALDPADADLDDAIAVIGRRAGGLDVDERQGDVAQLVNQGYSHGAPSPRAGNENAWIVDGG
jgi:hypothetical protein